MSRMRTDRKPPLARSPTRLRPPCVLLSNSTTTTSTLLQITPVKKGSLRKSKKAELNPRMWEEEDAAGGMLRPQSMSCELRALANMVHGEPGNSCCFCCCLNNSITARGFERGRFYDEYSARRNQRLNNRRLKNNINNNNNIVITTSYENEDASFKTPSCNKVAGLGVTTANAIKKKKAVPPAAAAYCYSSLEGNTTCDTNTDAAAYCYSSLEGNSTCDTNTAAATATATAGPPRYMLRSMSKQNREASSRSSSSQPQLCRYN